MFSFIDLNFLQFASVYVAYLAKTIIGIVLVLCFTILLFKILSGLFCWFLSGLKARKIEQRTGM